MSILYQPEKVYSWATILRKLFEVPGVVSIQGPGKCGKTDFALKISEDLKKVSAQDSSAKRFEPLIHDVASNIDTGGHYQQVYDLVTLKNWLYGSNRRKLFIMDEANEHLSNLRVMSGQNVGFGRLLPQVTKAHARMIVVGHSLQRVDGSILDDAWCKGIFFKENLKIAQLFSHLFSRPQRFVNINKTKVWFDPYAVAPFQEKASGTLLFKDSDLQMLWDWSQGKTYKDLGCHQMQLHRKLKKYVAQTLENEHNK